MTATSFWQNKKNESENPLLTDHSQEVCIVGAGIAGLTAAYILAKNNRKVTVVHAGSAFSGETNRSSAQLNTVHDDGWREMLKLHGEDSMRLCAKAYREAVDFIKNIVISENISCDFEELPAYLFSTTETGGENWIDSEIEAAKKCGVEGIEKANAVPLPQFKSGAAIKYLSQAQFNPTKYLEGLRELLLNLGVKIFDNTEIVSVESSNSENCTLTCANGSKIDSDYAILASNVPFHHRLIPIEALEAYRSYVIVVPLLDEHKLENAQYWDNLDPYHYVRLLKSKPGSKYDLLLIGGEDQRVGQVDSEKEKYSKLLKWGLERFPIVKDILYSWSAQTIETFDRMPLIGKAPGDSTNVQIITGDSGTGLIHGTLGAMITSDFIIRRENRYSELFSASRGRTKSLTGWIGQNLESLAQYKDWITPSDEKSIDQLKRDDGTIVREGLEKVAIYKDKNGKIEKFSAICPHLGAILRWNSIEKTFDCPAHGSRFCPNGENINGPACGALTKRFNNS